MKKLLYLISLASVLTLVISCSDRNKGPKVIKNTDTVDNSATLSDTLKSEGQSITSDSVVGVGSNGTVKDSTIDHGKPNVIIHGSPDQAKLDSIKNAKQKERNN